MQMTALPNRDVVFVRFQNEASSHSCLPYFIAIDEHSHSVGQCSLLSSFHAVSLGSSDSCFVTHISQSGTSSLSCIWLVAAATSWASYSTCIVSVCAVVLAQGHIQLCRSLACACLGQLHQSETHRPKHPCVCLCSCINQRHTEPGGLRD